MGPRVREDSLIWSPHVHRPVPTAIHVKPAHWMRFALPLRLSDLPSPVSLPLGLEAVREGDDGTRRRRSGARGLRLLQVRRPAPQDLCKLRPFRTPPRPRRQRARTLAWCRGLELGPCSRVPFCSEVVDSSKDRSG